MAAPPSSDVLVFFSGKLMKCGHPAAHPCDSCSLLHVVVGLFLHLEFMHFSVFKVEFFYTDELYCCPDQGFLSLIQI